MKSKEVEDRYGYIISVYELMKSMLFLELFLLFVFFKGNYGNRGVFFVINVCRN